MLAAGRPGLGSWSRGGPGGCSFEAGGALNTLRVGDLEFRFVVSRLDDCG